MPFSIATCCFSRTERIAVKTVALMSSRELRGFGVLEGKLMNAIENVSHERTFLLQSNAFELILARKHRDDRTPSVGVLSPHPMISMGMTWVNAIVA